MKKILFIFAFTYLLTPINEGPFINVSFIEPNCSNSCLSNFSDIEKCNAEKIILEDLEEMSAKN